MSTAASLINAERRPYARLAPNVRMERMRSARLAPNVRNDTIPSVARKTTRIERDSMGEMEVPVDAYYGASTQRAVLNFPISGQPFPRRFIRALGLIKNAAPETNLDLGLLPLKKARAIVKAAQEVVAGKLHKQIPIHLYHTGAATSTNTH